MKPEKCDEMVEALLRIYPCGGGDYYGEMAVINSHTTLRRLWIAEGKRRGYSLN